MSHKEHNITAIIYDKRGRILSIGKNSYIKSHPLMARFSKEANLDCHKIFLHAEVSAIVKCKDLSKAHKIVVMRFGKTGKPLNAKPCPACELAIKYAGIKIVQHT